MIGFAILWLVQFFVLDKISFKHHHFPVNLHEMVEGEEPTEPDADSTSTQPAVGG